MTTAISPAGIVQELVDISGVGVSPDGKHISYVRATYNKESGKKESQIWIADIDGSNRRQLTHVGTGNAGPAWSPDGSQLAYVSQREGDKPGAIVVLPLAAGGEARVVTQHAFPPAGLVWSPDGTRLAYSLPVDPDNPVETPRDPKAPAKVRVIDTVDYKLDGIGYRGETRFQLFVVDVASGSATGERRQLTSGLNDFTNARWSPDGKTLAATVWHGSPLDASIALIDVASAKVDIVQVNAFFIGSPTWSPSGKTVIFDSGLVTFQAVDVESKTAKEVSGDLGFMPGGLYNPEGNPVWLDEETILTLGFQGTRTGLFKVRITDGEATYIATWDGFLGALNPTPDKKTLIQSITDLSGVTGIAAVNAETGEKTLLFEENRAFFDEFAPAKWEIVSVDRDGLYVEGLLLKPADFDPAKKYPVILDIHGGPQGAHLQNINNYAQVLATHGFVVLQPNPRGSSGYGKSFMDGVINEWGKGDFQDLLALLDKVLEQPWADSERTGVGGYSYGGFMTSWTLGQTTRFKAAVCGAPVFDLESFYGTSDIGHLFGPMQWGGTPWEKREVVLSHSPSQFIHNATTPTLIVCGEADDRCPIGQSEQLYISLLKLGIDAEFARYPGGSHGFIVFGEPAHQIDYIERSLAWYKTYLGDPV